VGMISVITGSARWSTSAPNVKMTSVSAGQGWCGGPART
jgi:hypothetical protein